MKYFIVICFFITVIRVHAQQPDSVRVQLDSVPVRYDTLSEVSFPDSVTTAPVMRKGRIGRFFTNNYPDPGKAALFSAIIPGAGQLYNGRWWKVPIVYGILGGLTALEINRIKEYRLARDNYRWAVDGDPATMPTGKFEGRTDASLRSYRNGVRRDVEIATIILSLAYLMNIGDAFVDAHLHRFDVNEDLGFRLYQGVGPTLSLRYDFGGKH